MTPLNRRLLWNAALPLDTTVASSLTVSKTLVTPKEATMVKISILWGWTNGPFSSSNYVYSFDLQTGNGAVGTMSVTYDGNEAVNEIHANHQLWLKEVHALCWKQSAACGRRWNGNCGTFPLSSFAHSYDIEPCIQRV